MAKELALLMVLLVASGLVMTGVALWSVPSALVLGGVLVAALGIVFLADVGEST